MKPPSARPDVPEIVAHRGDAEHFPENTLPALEAAWRLGLRYVELDVQLSADCVPYVIHDAGLERTTDATGDVRLLDSARLDEVDAGEPSRFGSRHSGTRLPRLAAVAELMRGLPDTRAFVEIKRGSLAHHGHAHCVGKVVEALGNAIERCVAISFDAEACRLARAIGGMAVGWVLHDPPSASMAVLEELRPEFLFCDHRRLPAGGPLPQGSWRWVIYEVTDAPTARRLHARGVPFVETMAPARLQRELAATVETA